MDYISTQRLIWRSRRSLLELDLYFDKFIKSGGFAQLSDEELNNYNELLEMEDSDLLLLFQGKVRLADSVLQSLIDKVKQ